MKRYAYSAYYCHRIFIPGYGKKENNHSINEYYCALIQIMYYVLLTPMILKPYLTIIKRTDYGEHQCRPFLKWKNILKILFRQLDCVNRMKLSCRRSVPGVRYPWSKTMTVAIKTKLAELPNQLMTNCNPQASYPWRIRETQTFPPFLKDR